MSGNTSNAVVIEYRFRFFLPLEDLVLPMEDLVLLLEDLVPLEYLVLPLEDFFLPFEDFKQTIYLILGTETMDKF